MKWRIILLFSSIFMNFYIYNGIFANQDVFLYQGCDVGRTLCKLRCYFNTTAENFNVTWTLNDEPLDTSIIKNVHLRSLYLSKLTLNKDDYSTGNYTCTGYDDETDQTMAHSFPIDGNQSMPNILNSSYEIIGEGNCNVTFTCLIQAVPAPTVEWLKQDLDATKSSIVSGHTNSTISIDGMSNAYIASLTITNYSTIDVAKYACMASNGIGMKMSKRLFPYVPPGYPVISEQSVTFKPGDVVHLNCTSLGGFPAPNISWRVFSGQHANLSESFAPVDNGLSVAYMDIRTSWNADNVRIRCNVQDTTGQSDDQESAFVTLYLTDTPYLVSEQKCSVGDFTKSGHCSLSCEVYSPKSVSLQWLYRFDTFQEPYPLTNISFPSRSIPNGPYRGFLNLTELNYRAGLYECKFVSPAGNITNTFHINGTKQIGDALGKHCTDNSAYNCGTWNSECYQPTFRCFCPYDYPIKSESRSSACLPVAPPDTLCLNSRQCDAAERNYECFRQFSFQQYGYCQCKKPFFKIYIHETAKYQCIAKVPYQSRCAYDAQCQLSDPFLECDEDDHKCECVDGYYYSSSYNYCQYGSDSSGGLSTTAAIIITFSILIVIVFIVTLIFLRTNSRNVRRLNRARARRAAQQSGAPLRPFTLPDNWSEGEGILPPYTTTEIAPPPSYHEAQRCETPPPAFESIIGTKPDDDLEDPERDVSAAADDGLQLPSASGIFHIFENDSTLTGFLNPAYEDDC